MVAIAEKEDGGGLISLADAASLMGLPCESLKAWWDAWFPERVVKCGGRYMLPRKTILRHAHRRSSRGEYPPEFRGLPEVGRAFVWLCVTEWETMCHDIADDVEAGSAKHDAIEKYSKEYDEVEWKAEMLYEACESDWRRAHSVLVAIAMRYRLWAESVPYIVGDSDEIPFTGLG